MVIHLHGKKVTHLSVSGHYILEKGDMADHILQSAALIKVVHDDAHATLIFGDQLNTAVLDPVVIDNERSHINGKKHSQSEPEKVLHSASAHVLHHDVALHIWLLFIRLEDDFEIRDDHAALERWHIAQVVLAHHIVDDAVLLLTDLNLVLPQALNVLLGDNLAKLFDAWSSARLFHHYLRAIFVDLSCRLL